MVWGKAGSTDITSGDALTLSSVLDSKFYTFLYLSVPSGDMTEYQTVGNGTKDTGNNYANRKGKNGAEGTFNSRANWVVSAKSGATQPEFAVGYIFNIAGEEKLMNSRHINANASGAGSIPDRQENAGKWANTSDVMDVISFDNTGTGDYATGTNLSALGSDLTPAAAVPAVPAVDSVQDNSIFVETDTARRYWFDAESSNTVTLQSDFSSSTGWTTSSSSLLNVDTSAQEIDFTFNVDNGDLATMYYDLTSTSDTKWVLRSQVDIDTIAQGSDTSDKWLFYGLSSTNNGANETQDFLGMAIRVDNTKTELLAIETDGSAPNNESTTVFTRNAQAETLYVEMIRESATSFTINLYSDSAYSTLLESKTITASSGTATLRYLKFAGLQGFSDSQVVGSVPNITLYNDVTSATIPATWYGEDAEKFYDTSATSSNVDYILQVASAGHGTRAGVTVLAGSDAINRKIQYVKFKLRKFSSPSGNYQITVRDSSDTIKATANFDVTALPTTAGLVEHDLGSEVLLAEGDRILYEYGGASGTNLYLNDTSGTSGFSATLYNYSSAYVTDATDTIIAVMDSQGASI